MLCVQDEGAWLCFTKSDANMSVACITSLTRMLMLLIGLEMDLVMWPVNALPRLLSNVARVQELLFG